MTIAGTWQLIVATPLGKQAVVLELAETDDGITGVASGNGEQVPLLDPVRDGDRLTWGQAVTRPMRLHLRFAVTVAGDTLTGTACAGALPASRVTGSRVVTR